MIEAELADGRVLEFPDDTPPEVVQGVVKKLMQPQAQAPAEEPNTAGRILGRTARAAIKGVTGLPAMMADSVIPAINAGFGTKIPLQGQAVEGFLDQVGLPRPQNAEERIFDDAASAVGGVAGAGRAGMQLLQDGTGEMTKRIGQFFAANPALQGAAAAGATGAGGIAREQGADMPTQIAASLIGGAIPAGVAGVARPAGDIGKKLIEPLSEAGRGQIKGRLLNELTGEKRSQVIEALKNNQAAVPGGRNTAALAAAEANVPQLSAAEKLLKDRYAPDEFADIVKQNEGARSAAIGKISGSPGQLEGAIKARALQSEEDYANAFRVKIQADPALAKLVRDNPFIKEAIPDATRLAQAAKITPKKDLTEFLHYLKLSVDKSASRVGDTALSKTEQRAAAQAAADLNLWLRKNNPAYDAAKENFKANSAPINRMEIGRYLQDKLEAPLSAAERPGVFAQAMRDAPRTIKNATGARFNELDQVLEQPEVQTLEAIQRELAKIAMVKQQQSQGMEMARDKLGTTFALPEPPSLLNRGITLLRAGMERMQGGATEKTLGELAQDLRDPQVVARLMQNASPQEKIGIMLAVKQITQGAGAGTVQSAPLIEER